MLMIASFAPREVRFCADSMGQAARIMSIGADVTRTTEPPMPRQRKPNDLSRSLIALDMDTTLIAVVELSLSSWLVAGIVPGVERQPLKKLKTDESALLALLNR